jgi:hypothetical protein
MRRLTMSITIAGAALVGAGCSKVPDAVSCTVIASADGGVPLTVCEEFSGLSTDDQEALSMSCFVSNAPADAGVQATAQFAYAPCPRAGVLGGCRLIDAATGITFWYYAGGPYTAADIPTVCGQTQGTYLPP